METEVESDKPPNSTPDEAPAPDIQLISTENSETPLRENSHPAEDTPVREPLTEDESSIVTIDSDDNDYANPEPPRELVEQQLLGADTIGNTVFSKHWLFTTLMKLLEAVDREAGTADDSVTSDAGLDLDDGLQDELCKLWDMSMNQEVVSFLMEFKAVQLLSGVIGKSKAPRAVEICVGILGNMACTETACQAISENDIIREELLLLVGSPDAPTLVETTRLLNICVSQPSVADLWVTSIKADQGFYSAFLFILQSSTNTDLLTNAADVIDKLMYREDSLLISWSTPELVQATLEAIKQCGSRKDTVDTFLHILQLVSTCEAGIALGPQSTALCELTLQYLTSLCSEDILVIAGQEDSVGSALSVLATAFTALDEKSTLLNSDFQLIRCLVKILGVVYPSVRHFQPETRRQRSRTDSKCSRGRRSRSPTPEKGAEDEKVQEKVDDGEAAAIVADDSDDDIQITGSEPATHRLEEEGGVMELLYEVLQNVLTDVVLVLSEDEDSTQDTTNDDADNNNPTTDSNPSTKPARGTPPASLVYLNDLCERQRLRILIHMLDEVNQDTELDCCGRLRNVAQTHSLTRLESIITEYATG